MEKPEILGIALFPALVISTLIIALSCGPNPPFAPFGSTITITNPPSDFSIPLEALSTIRVEASVLGPDGLPLNDVRVFWRVSFAGPQSLVIDTDGDGDADAPALQLIDPDACGDITRELLTIPELFDVDPLPFVDSPFPTTTDNRGVSAVVILINGRVEIVPASIEASLENGDPPAIAEFNVNVRP